MNYKRRQEELAKYEENFNEIYETTGVKDVNEIIQKFTSQEETTKSLEDIKQEHSEKIEFHKRAFQLLKDELNKLKYMGSDNLTRQQIDEIDNSVQNATAKCERIKAKYDRISSVLVNAKAGIEHLADKLVFFILQGKPNISVTDETLVEALAQIVDKLKMIYLVIKNEPNFISQEE